jgi:N-acetylmuramoyl-L-alanine amidase/peptidoglycan/xylan/chitin deacetylase (PgdA/CDA1 family)
VLVAVGLAAAGAVGCGRGTEDGTVRIETVGTVTPGASGAGQAAGDQRITVFLDPGHGGRDPGWGSSYILPDMPLEKDLTLDIARRTAAYLEEKGYRVVLSRTADSDVNEPERDLNGDGCIEPIDEVQARIDAANASGASVLVSIHFNGLPGTQLSGSATFYNAVREFSDDNKRLAGLLQAAQLEVLAGFGHQARDWGAIRDDSFESPTQSDCPNSYRYYTLIGPAAEGRPRPSKMPGAIIEAMFLTYPKEAELARSPEVRDSLAKGYARAIDQYFHPDQSGGAPRSTDDTTRAVDTRADLVDRGRTSRKELALTFDAGAETGYAAAILDTLKRKGVQATFGLTGAWAESNPDLARRITAEGHAVINHTYSHASWTGQSPGTKPLSGEQRRREVERAERAIEGATGADARPFFRSPYGDQDAGVQRDLGALGYRYNVLWTFDSGAWKGAKAEAIINRGIRAAAPGAIYVFHVAEQQDSLALEPLIDGLAAAGYSFVTVPYLLSDH